MITQKSDILEKVLNKIEELWDDEVAFLQKIGSYPSTLGNEAALQNFIASYFTEEMQLQTDKFVPDVKRISRLPGYSPVEWSYAGRPVVVGQWKTNGPKIGKSLILQGHIDVVSPEPVSLWNYNPWGSTIVGDRMYGRGLQDMKSGTSAMIFAVKAIKEAGIELGADVLLQTVIEEECTGNGALAALDRGYVADGALIPEPFGPTALKAQVGVIWVRVRVTGLGAHVERADRAVNAIEKAYILINALGEYRKYINSRPKHPAFKDINHPLNVNVGKIHAGDWPSNVPAECVFEARIGFYPDQDPQQIKDEVKAWLLEAAKEDEWLHEVEPEITFYGFHAEGVSLDEDMEIFDALKNAHKTTTGEELQYFVSTCTTDIRFYNLYYGIPATCYGPVGGSMHGADEWVNLPSVKAVTKTYAAFILDWCGIRN
ncbi:ArgE/DapE family deacylase [Effusibacillus lacus]|uniref:Acetylornithine deacetylase n=1 Tax=Effusibacillus lacus TaxID=1348429 RepID=A0A292YE09_9BACL|nr:ArgE/DapE family deacylase [Effusibacillus lacus]TCS72559.1 acetylornithine deacetylase [Effusibacillus lacus]GAX90882.1 acetylornithine deacetylase [Effusibacillus lacus]